MAFRIETRSIIPDARSVSKCGFFNALGLSATVKKVEILDCYTVDARMSPKQMETAAKLLTNPLIEQHQIVTSNKKQVTRNFDYAIEISFLPGVTDNIGHTAKETLQDGAGIKFLNGQGVYSSTVFFISGKLNEADIKKISDSLHNPLIQKATVKSFAQFKKDKGFAPNLPKVNLHNKAQVLQVDLNLADEALAQIGKQGIMDPKTKTRRGPLSLDLDQLKVIRSYFHKLGRNPTDVELETLAQTWSEHCKHTIFADPLDEIKDGIYRHYIKRATNIVRAKSRTKNADFCVSVFSDNSGGIIFDEKYLITHKVETHNSPSALDPFGGAITGIGGVNRDALGFGLGAKPIINTYGFCLSTPDDKTILYRDAAKTNPMLSARRIMDGVIAGINAGGNQSGIPTNSGFLFFDANYRGKPLVFAGTVGLIPRNINGKPSHIKQAKPGDLVVTIGGRVGLDGIHGATFASEGLDAHSPATAVQIGDPITQKKFSDCLVREARDLGLYNSITDCGAGGLSSAVGEMATQAGGCLVNLDKAPAKYPGLHPWQIWISESQERMVVAVLPKKWKVLESLLKKRGVESTVIGKFTADGKCVLKYKNKTVMDISLDFLHDGRPIKYQMSSNPSSRFDLSPPSGTLSKPGERKMEKLILNLLKRPNIASTAFVSRQYDHEVQGSSVAKPLQGKGLVNAQATVSRPVLASKKGVVLSYGLSPEYSEFDCYHMAAAAIDSAIRSSIAAGARLNHLALLDNFCWPSGNDPARLWQLKQAAKACFDYAVAFGTPFISGKDSMFNDFKGFDEDGKPMQISIPPTLLISAISVMEDITKAVTLDAKMPGDVIYLIGDTNIELGGSEYNKMLGIQGGKVPKVDAKRNLKSYLGLQSAIEHELVASATSLDRGGLAVALSKMLIAGQLGAEVNLSKLPGNWKHTDEALFSESQGRILVTVDPKKEAWFKKIMRGNVLAKVGSMKDNKMITIIDGKNKIAEIPLSQATNAYRSTFKEY